MRLPTLLTSLVILVGCSAVSVDDVVLDAKPATPQIRALLAEAARNTFFDPYSVRDAEISYMGKFPNGTEFVCGKGNAKNGFGGYSGRQTLAIYFRGGQITGSGDNPRICNNPNMKWQQFSELEAL